MSQTGEISLLALGGNMPSVHGDSASTISAAIRRIEELAQTPINASKLYRTPCFPAAAGPDYVNAAAMLHYGGTPSQMLALLHRIEAEMGRERVQRWGRRTLDLDLIAAGGMILPDVETQTYWRDLPQAEQIEKTPDQLILPHPRLQDRAFVLVPLADVAPGWVHPVLGQSVQQMLSELPEKDRNEVVAL